MAETTHTTFCRICEALCGLEVTVTDGKVTRIRPDDAHVATEGFACFKGIKQHQLYDSPDRLTHVQHKAGADVWIRQSWDDALGAIGAKVRRIVAEDGPNAVAMYVGTAAGFGVLHPVFAQGFMAGIGSDSMYASATQDCANKFAVAREMYGFPFTQPFPDIERSECLVIVGANPVVSKWSFLQVTNPTQRLRDMTARGAKVYVVDPRRTETARHATEWVPIRPGTDVFFYLAFLHELLAAGGVDAAVVAAHTTGLDEIRALVAEWTPQRCAEVTGIPAAKLKEIVAAYLAANGAALYSSTGVNMGGAGTTAFWLQEVINVVSGNLDRPGGTLVGHGVIDFARFGVRTGTLMKDARSRVGGFQTVNDAFPGGILADEILTPGKGRVRALFVTGGNPLLTMANAGRLREAFGQLDLLVCVDIFRTETASVGPVGGTWALPATSPLQRPDLPFVFPLMLGMQRKPYLQATRAIVPPEGDQRDEGSIYVDLCRASGVSLFGSGVAQRAMEGLIAAQTWRRRRSDPAATRGLPQELLLSALLRVTRQGSFATLAKSAHGRRRPQNAGGDFLGRRVVSPDGQIALAPERLLAQTASLGDRFAQEQADAGRLKLITKRHVKTHNSWTHNHPDFVNGDHDRNYLYVHPVDAARIGLAEGDLADVSSATATVRVPVRILDDLSPGAVALPHGWGHQPAGDGLKVASATPGVNVNLLAADGPDRIDAVSGMAHLTGIVVDVVPADGPQAHTWSGLPEPAVADDAATADVSG